MRAAERVRKRAGIPRVPTASKAFERGWTGLGVSPKNCEALGSLMQEVGKQLFHDLGLVDGDDVISVVNDLDARLGQSLAETGCHLRPIVERFVSADDHEDRNLGS